MVANHHPLAVAVVFVVASSAAVTLAVDLPQFDSVASNDGKLDSILKGFYDEAVTAAGEGRKLIEYDVPSDMIMSTEGQVTVEVIVNDEENIHAFKASLEESDEFIINGCFKNECSVKTEVLSLGLLQDNDWVIHIFSNFVSLEPIEISPSVIEQLNQIMPPYIQRSSQRADEVSEASRAMFADRGRDQFNVDGTGIKIGVLSDSFNCAGSMGNTATTVEDDIANGDLPPLSDIHILQDYFEPGCTDEGRAMMQLIHGVAPGASLAFRSALLGQAAFAEGIIALANAGCDIIVDDKFFPFAHVYQDGIIAQAVDIVKEMGVTYFTSVGNRDRQAWEGRFVPVLINYFGTPYTLLSFDGSGSESSTVLPVSLDTGGYIAMFWSEPILPFDGSSNRIPNEADLVIHGFRPGGSIYDFANDVRCRPFQIESYPVPILLLECPSGDIDIVIFNLNLGPNPDSVYMYFSRGSIRGADPPPGSFAGTAYGHKNTNGAIEVGASYFINAPGFGTSPAILNDYSSAGGLPIYFDTNGQQLEKREIRKTPSVVGPDATCTSFFFSADPNFSGCYRFFGTSASAPNVAAVAALLLEINPNLEPDDIRSILEYTAQDMDSPFTPWFDSGFDYDTGYGFVNAQKAMVMASEQLPSSSPSTIPSIFPSSSPSYEYCIDDPSAACKFDDDGEPTHFSICTSEEDDEYKAYCVKINDYADLSIGDNYMTRSGKRMDPVVVGCGCCEPSNFPPGAKLDDIDKNYCYRNSVCGKPGDATFVICDEKKGIAKVAICVEEVDFCVDADDVVGNDPTICGPCN